MTDAATLSAPMAILGSGLCIPDEDVAGTLGFADAGVDASILSPLLRRRTSNATRVAISAAGRACAAAGGNHTLPAIFVSSVGEMQVTDQLCRSITRREFPLSPTLFHNSVHNTAAGYWSMATGSMAAMQAMGALDDGLALGLLEAWCQLQTVTEQVLLVVFDETLPVQLLPDYAWQTCAFALVLGQEVHGYPWLHRPFQSTAPDPEMTVMAFPARNPAMACLPLFQALQQATGGKRQIALSPGARPWRVDMVIP